MDPSPEPERAAQPFFTIGHSTRPIEEFVGLAAAADVHLIVDVRTVPRSARNPQYNRETLPATLAPFGLDYIHIAALGGLRGGSRGVSPEVNAGWQNKSFHNYADYAMSEAFGAGLAELRTLGHARRCAIMCAEAVWWRCHRRIITDYLLAAGESVFHILAKDRIEPARMSEAARPGPHGALIYPPDQLGLDV